MEAEAKAYELGIMFAKDMRFHEIALEGDSVMVSNAIAGTSPPPSSIASVVYGISSLLSAFCRFSISHFGRKANQVAHLLAKPAQELRRVYAVSFICFSFMLMEFQFYIQKKSFKIFVNFFFSQH